MYLKALFQRFAFRKTTRPEQKITAIPGGTVSWDGVQLPYNATASEIKEVMDKPKPLNPDDIYDGMYE